MLASIPQTQEVWEIIAKEEWNKWRLIMAEDCSITFQEAFSMSDIDLAVANAALNIAMKQKSKASKPKKKGG